MKPIIILLLMFIAMCIGYMLSNVIYVKKETTVTITDCEITYESNSNRDGDTYTIIINQDTVSTGIIVNGEWE